MSKRSRAARSRPGGSLVSRGTWMAAAAAALLAALVLLRGQGGPPSPAAQAIAAPDFELVVYQGEEELGFRGGQFSSLFDHGKPVVLNFWAGLCPPCRAEMPDFQRVYDARRDEFLLLGLDVGPHVGLGSNEDGRALLNELRISYPAGAPPSGSVVRAYQVRGMPTTVFLTAEGEIFATHTGPMTAGALNQMIDRLLAASSS